MSDYLHLPAENILKEDTSVKHGTKYVIYINPEDYRQNIHINTFYILRGDSVELCTKYDRSLCGTIDEYYRLDPNYIESQAYGAYMDGAR